MALTIFLYHSVDDTGSFLSVPTDTFRAQMQALARSRREVIPVAEAARRMQAGASLSNAVCITFDDGYQSVAETAWPILRDLGLSATTYFVNGVMGQRALWLERMFPEVFGDDPETARATLARQIDPASIRDPGIAADPVRAFRDSARLPVMTWDIARTLVAEGMDPGGHTKTHPSLPNVPDAKLDAELGDARRELQDRLSNDVLSFAYPFGDYTPATLAAVQRAGYAAAVTSLAGPVRHPQAIPFEWQRIGIWPNVSARKLTFYSSPLYNLLKRLRP